MGVEQKKSKARKLEHMHEQIRGLETTIKQYQDLVEEMEGHIHTLLPYVIGWDSEYQHHRVCRACMASADPITDKITHNDGCLYRKVVDLYGLPSTPEQPGELSIADKELNDAMKMVYLLSQVEGKDIPEPPYIRP